MGSDQQSVLINARHTLNYTYSRGVFCEPVTIRLRPRDDAFQKLINWTCSISPEPVGTSQFRGSKSRSAFHAACHPAELHPQALT